MPDWLLIPGQYFACLFCYAFASFWWRVDQALLLAAVLINYFRQWIQTDILDFTLSLLFQPGNDNGLLPFIAGGVMLAVVVGAIFLLLRPLLIHSSPVDFRKIIGWLVLTGWLFSNRGSIFHDLEAFRNSLASSAYETAIVINNHIGGSGYNTTNGEVPSPGAGTITIPQLFPQTTHQYGPDEVTALDTAAYYLEAAQNDIALAALGNVTLPDRFYQDYYTTGGVQFFPVPSGNDVRTAAVSRAMAGVGIMTTGIVPAVVAIIQALISLSFALAATILFFSLPVALPFAFFTSTEAIALGIVRAYITLVVKTYVVNLILAIFQGFLIFWAGSGNIAGFLAMAAVVLYFSFQFMRLASQTLHQSITTITSSIGQVTGTQLWDPVAGVQQITGKILGAAATAGAVAATGGAALPAAAGALLSSSGLPGGSALIYGATRQATPGDFARRSLATRQAATGDLAPAEVEEAEDAAGVLAGRRAGDPLQARQVLSTLGTKAAQNRAAQAQIRTILADHGITSTGEDGQQLRALENLVGTNLRGTTLGPGEIQLALRAIAVLRDGQPGDPQAAQQLLQQYGERAALTRAWQSGIQQELAAVQILPPTNNESRPASPPAPPPPMPRESAPPPAPTEGSPGSDPGLSPEPPAASTPLVDSPEAPTAVASGAAVPPLVSAAPSTAGDGLSAAPQLSTTPRTSRPRRSAPPAPAVVMPGVADGDFDPLAALPVEALVPPPAEISPPNAPVTNGDSPPPVATTASGEALPEATPSTTGEIPAGGGSPMLITGPNDELTVPEAPLVVTTSAPADDMAVSDAPLVLAPAVAESAPAVPEAPVVMSAARPEVNGPVPAEMGTDAPVGDTAEPPAGSTDVVPEAPRKQKKKSGRKDSSRFYWMHRNRTKGGV